MLNTTIRNVEILYYLKYRLRAYHDAIAIIVIYLLSKTLI